jgi:hypothetical protein
MPKFTASKPIANSSVYIDGEHIEPPYIVSASNLAVYINGRIVCDFTSRVWIPPYVPKTRPELPQEINKGTSMYDEHFRLYIQDACSYLMANAKSDGVNVLDEMFRVYQSSPNVKSVERDEKRSGTFHITYQDGGTVSTLVLPLTGRRPPYRLDNVGTHIDQLCESYVTRLTQGFRIKINQGVEIESTKLPDAEEAK